MWRVVALLIAALLLGLAALPARARPAPSTSPFGVVAQTDPSEAEFETMREGGVATYRWLVSWPAVQPGAGAPLDWAATDRVVAQLAEHDIRPLPVVFGSPCFAVDCALSRPRRPSVQAPVGSARALAAWTRFLASAVDRYGPSGSFWTQNPSLPQRPIRAWQIWNEPNSPRYYAPAPSARGYTDLLRASSEAISAHDRDARIVLGGLPAHPESPRAVSAADFLAQLYRRGAQRYFDAVAVHPYAPDVAGVERQIRAIRRVMESHGAAAAQLWVTEIGWGTSPTGEGRLVETVDGQAGRLEELFGLALERREQWNLDRVLWYAWRDTPSGQQVCGWCGTSGLFDEGLRARPAWTSFAELSGGTPAGPGGESGFPVPVILAIAAAAAIVGVGGAWLWHRRGGRSNGASL